MRALAAVVVLSLAGASPPAIADTWRTRVALMEAGSSWKCRQADVSKMFYDFTVTDNQFLTMASSSERISAPVAADGSVRTTFTGSLGARKFSLELVGNVRTRNLEAFNSKYSCRFKLTPVE